MYPSGATHCRKYMPGSKVTVDNLVLLKPAVTGCEICLITRHNCCSRTPHIRHATAGGKGSWLSGTYG